MNSHKLYSALAGVAMVAGIAGGLAPSGASAATSAPSQIVNATPTPSIVTATPPSPAPTQPPQALSCTSNQNFSASVYGMFPISSSSPTQASTTIQVIPNSTDGRSYLAFEEQQVLRQQALQAAQRANKNGVPGGAPSAPPSNFFQVQNDSQNFAALAQRLAPYIETTTTDSSGNWACADLTYDAPYLLFATLTINKTTTTPVPAAIAALTSTKTTTSTQTTQVYYAAKAVVNFDSKNLHNRLFPALKLPFGRFTKIAELDPS
ncbi:MAG: hypothetical protein ACLPYS_14790 [Vulcanimicrobiaceae bacterium]